MSALDVSNTPTARLLSELGAQDRRSTGHGAHLALGTRPRQVLHPAVGGAGDAGRWGGREGPAYPIGDQLGRLGLRVGQVDDAQDDVLVAEVLQDSQLETRLRGLDRDLVGRGA